MDPFFAKIVFLFGFVVANFLIRTPYIKAHKRLPIRSNRNTRLDTSVVVGVLGFLLPLLYVFTPLFSFADYSIPRWIGATGVAVLVLGNWIFWRSHKDLGGNWSPTLDIRQDHKLVTEGIYQRIRHPMYLSLWLLVIAQAMILPNYVAGFAALVPFGILYFQRVAREERMIIEEFGGDTNDTCRKPAVSSQNSERTIQLCNASLNPTSRSHGKAPPREIKASSRHEQLPA